MVRKLISGGQTGADISIVRVGRQLNIPTGGVVPRGWMTETGPDPLLETHGFIQADTTDYRSRTICNLEDSDATLVFATVPDSDGSRLTMEHATSIGRPCLLVNPFDKSAVEKVQQWLQTVRPTILNIAGNRESVSPGITESVEQVLLAALARGPGR